MKLSIPLMLLLFAANGLAAAERKDPPAAKAKAGAVEIKDLLPEDARNMLPGGGWFTWKFSEKPKLGTVIVKVQVFGKDGKQQKPYEITGESGMPAMRYHDSGPIKFKLNKKGDYLLPVDVVMPGEWKLLIRVKAGKKEIYAGKVVFTV